MYQTCKDYEDDCDDIRMLGPIYKLSEEEIKDVRYVLSKKENRAFYDRSQTFVRKGAERKLLQTVGQ